MQCIIEAELTPTRFSELGNPYRIFRESTQKLVAVASQMPHLGYPGHGLFPDVSPAQHRLSIYHASDGTMLGCISTKYPINDVALSPDGENVLIATGSYDGGWCFGGYLLRFCWRSGHTEQLLGQCREFVACRYDEDGTVTALMRPENEEEFGEDGLDAWSIVLCVKIESGPGPWSGESVEVPRQDQRLEGLMPSVPGDHGFPASILSQNPDQRHSWQQEACDWLREVKAEYYCGIWDLRWQDHNTFALVAHGLAIEQRSIHAGVLKRVECEGYGVELIDHPQLGLLSHIQLTGPHGGSIDTTSELWRWRGNQHPTKLRFERPYAFSFDSFGNGLAIDVSWANQRDRKNLLLGPSGNTLQSIDCGVTDRLGPTSFPHNLDALYFLKREGEEAYRNNDYWLWCSEGGGRFICLRPWDTSELDFCPVVAVARLGTELLGAGSVWNRSVPKKLGSYLELRDLRNGHRTVSIELPSSPTSVALSPDRQTAIVGLVDGRIGFFDLRSKRTIGETVLPYEVARSVPLSLSIREDRMLVGTQDGRVLLTRLVA